MKRYSLAKYTIIALVIVGVIILPVTITWKSFAPRHPPFPHSLPPLKGARGMSHPLLTPTQTPSVTIPLAASGSKLPRNTPFHYEFDREEDEEEQIENERSVERETDDPRGRAAFALQRLVNPHTGKLPEDLRSKELVFAQRMRQHKAGRTRAEESPAAEWKKAGPNELGGRTRALAIDLSDPSGNILLAGSATGGLWRTENKGKSWEPVTVPDEMRSISSLVQDTRAGKTNIWYAGTGEVFDRSDFVNDNAVIRGTGIYRSTDGGHTWQALPSTTGGEPHLYDNDFDYVWNFCVDESNAAADEVYAATATGIFRSEDGGDSWARVLGTESMAGRYTDIAIGPDGVLYAAISNIDGVEGFEAGIFRSEDGIRWESITPPDWPLFFQRTVLGLSSSGNTVYVLAHVGGSEHLLQVYRHEHGWTDLTAQLPDYTYDLGDYDSQGSFCMYVKVMPGRDDIVFLGGINLYRSTDGFTTTGNTQWIGGYDAGKTDRSKYPQHHPDQHALVLSADQRTMISSHDGGVSLTTEALAEKVEWQTLNNGYGTTQFYTVAMNPYLLSDAVIGGMQDNGTYGANSLDLDADWSDLLAGDGAHCAIANNGRRVYVSSQYGRIYRFDYNDNGNYTGFARVDPSGPDDYLFINPFVLDPYNTNRMYIAGGSHIWRNDNLAAIPGGSNETTNQFWTKLSTTSISGSIITALGISHTPQNILYYGTANGQLYRVDEAHSASPQRRRLRSTLFPNHSGNYYGYISSIAVDPFDADHILVSFSNYELLSVFESSDGGTSWEAVSGNLEEHPDGSGAGPGVYHVSMLRLNEGYRYFVGTTSGLYFTDELEGTNTQWQHAEAIGNVPVEMVFVRQRDGRVVVATHGNGLYTALFSDHAPFDFDPLTISMGQNYPNPFHRDQTTSIPVRIDEDMPVTITVTDVQGRRSGTAFSGTLTAGEHTLPLNAGSLTTGAYFYTLRAGDQIITKRMVIY